MKKVTIIFALLLVLVMAGSASAVVLDEPLELEEGMFGITAIEEPIAEEPIIDELPQDTKNDSSLNEPVSDDLTIQITALEEDGSVIAPQEGEVRHTAIGIEAGDEEGAATSVKKGVNPLVYAGGALVLLLGLFFGLKRKTV